MGDSAMEMIDVKGKIPRDFFKWVEIESSLEVNPEIRKMLSRVDLQETDGG